MARWSSGIPNLGVFHLTAVILWRATGTQPTVSFGFKARQEMSFLPRPGMGRWVGWLIVKKYTYWLSIKHSPSNYQFIEFYENNYLFNWLASLFLWWIEKYDCRLRSFGGTPERCQSRPRSCTSIPRGGRTLSGLLGQSASSMRSPWWGNYTFFKLILLIDIVVEIWKTVAQINFLLSVKHVLII